MASTLPGPIATKLAVTIGMQTGGAAGAAIALFALLLPSTVLVTLLAIIYYRYKDAPSVQGALKAIRPVVIALLLVTVAQLSPRSVVSWDTFLIALAAFAVVFYLRLHPIYTIVTAAFIGFIFYR
jgi:chromate transporter